MGANMSLSDRVTWAALNSKVMEDKFEYKNPNDWLYASLSQPPIKVLDKHATDVTRWLGMLNVQIAVLK